MPRNFNYNGTNLKQDIALVSLCPIYEDGLYELVIVGGTKIIDGAANANFHPTLGFTLAAPTVAFNDASTTVMAPGPQTMALDFSLQALNTAVISRFLVHGILLAGSVVTLVASGSLLTVGQYDLMASALRLA